MESGLPVFEAEAVCEAEAGIGVVVSRIAGGKLPLRDNTHEVTRWITGWPVRVKNWRG